MASTHETKFILSAKDNTKGAFNSVKSNIAGIGTEVAQLSGVLVGLAGAAGFGLLGVGLVDTNIQFQTMKSSLKTLTGSAGAADAMFDDITKFATTTPFALEQVAGAFIKLKALGLDPSEAAITSYGNTAAAMGKSLNQMIEAVADASTGEFERLKEFGITAKTQGDQVAFTFQGVTTTIGKNAAEITGYLQSIGSVNFAGAMDDQMQNVGPAFDNFSTAIDLLQTAIGEGGLNDAIANTTNSITDMINAFDKTVISEATQASLQALADVLHSIDSATTGVAEFLIAAQPGGGALPGAGEIGGGDTGYRLGSFNAAQGQGQLVGNRATALEEFQRTRGGLTGVDEIKEQTPILKRIADGIDAAVSKNAAVAG